MMFPGVVDSVHYQGHFELTLEGRFSTAGRQSYQPRLLCISLVLPFSEPSIEASCSDGW